MRWLGQDISGMRMKSHKKRLLNLHELETPMISLLLRSLQHTLCPGYRQSAVTRSSHGALQRASMPRLSCETWYDVFLSAQCMQTSRMGLRSGFDGLGDAVRKWGSNNDDVGVILINLFELPTLVWVMLATIAPTAGYIPTHNPWLEACWIGRLINWALNIQMQGFRRTYRQAPLRQA